MGVNSGFIRRVSRGGTGAGREGGRLGNEGGGGEAVFGATSEGSDVGRGRGRLGNVGGGGEADVDTTSEGTGRLAVDRSTEQRRGSGNIGGGPTTRSASRASTGFPNVPHQRRNSWGN